MGTRRPVSVSLSTISRCSCLLFKEGGGRDVNAEANKIRLIKTSVFFGGIVCEYANNRIMFISGK